MTILIGTEYFIRPLIQIVQLKPFYICQICFISYTVYHIPYLSFQLYYMSCGTTCSMLHAESIGPMKIAVERGHCTQATLLINDCLKLYIDDNKAPSPIVLQHLNSQACASRRRLKTWSIITTQCLTEDNRRPKSISFSLLQWHLCTNDLILAHCFTQIIWCCKWTRFLTELKCNCSLYVHHTK